MNEERILNLFMFAGSIFFVVIPLIIATQRLTLGAFASFTKTALKYIRILLEVLVVKIIYEIFFVYIIPPALVPVSLVNVVEVYWGLIIVVGLVFLVRDLYGLEQMIH